MIKIENTEVVGWEAAIRGMRNPLSSWQRSDSYYCNNPLVEACDGCVRNPDGTKDKKPNENVYCIGPNDHDLMKRLASNGPVHAKYRRMIAVYADITAPRFWWTEADTYKVGTAANSCSTMHTITKKEFNIDDFSVDEICSAHTLYVLNETISELNSLRDIYLNGGKILTANGIQEKVKKNDKRIWYSMIQILPQSYNQKRTMMLNYEVLANIYQYRKNHKLDEWREFCKWIEALPESWIITGKEAENECNLPTE